MAESSKSLRVRIAIYLGLMVAGSLLLGICAILGVERLHQDFTVASRGYRQLRQVYDVGFAVSTAKRSLLLHPIDQTSAIESLQRAQNIVEDRSTPWLDEH